MSIIKAIRAAIKDLIRDSKGKTFWRNPILHTYYRFAWHLKPELHIHGGNPLAVDVELSNGCNFRCTMCQQSTNWLDRKDEAFMSWDTLGKAVTECKQNGVISMKVNWRGESTLDSEVAEKISYIKSRGIHEVQMNTNASKLTPDLCDRLIESGLDRIIFSCDGLSKETYNKIRKGGDWEVFKRNVIMFRQRRNAKDLSRGFWKKGLPLIRINMAVMDQNRHEVPLFKDFFKDIADEIVYNTVYQPQAANINNGQHRTVKHKGCTQIWQRLIIGVDGSVVPCCVDYRQKLKLANINTSSIYDIWNRKERGIRNKHLNNQARDLEGCKGCDNFALSEYNDKGEVVWR